MGEVKTNVETLPTDSLSNSLKKYCIFCTQKVFSSFSNIKVEPLWSHGLFQQCL